MFSKQKTFVVKINHKNMIRIFTSGTHNGLTFSDDDIKEIARKTEQEGEEQIPIVLGHPENDLPIMGFLPKEAVKTYEEDGRLSIGFEKESASLSNESMEVLRQMGHNKLSPRLVEGVIRHIGLVDKAAVAENNTQDFAALTGIFSAHDDLFKKSSITFKNLFKKTNKTMENQETQMTTDDPVAEMKKKVDTLAQTVSTLAQLAEKYQQKEKQAEEEADKKAVDDEFKTAEFSHLTDTQKADFAEACRALPQERRAAFKESIKAMAKKPARPANGSVSAEFSAKEDKSSIDIIREQMSNL